MLAPRPRPRRVSVTAPRLAACWLLHAWQMAHVGPRACMIDDVGTSSCKYPAPPPPLGEAHITRLAHEKNSLPALGMPIGQNSTNVDTQKPCRS